MLRYLILTISAILAAIAGVALAQATTFGDGTFIVGTDIAAGLYRATPADGCYWARLKGFGGSTSDIIANNFSNGVQVAAINAADAGFETDGCGQWAPATTPVTTGLLAPFSDGTYIVGLDLAPGTWRAPGGSGCYWARLSGFSGSTRDIVANGLPSGAAIVTIAAGDKGFRADGCGQWAHS